MIDDKGVETTWNEIESGKFARQFLHGKNHL